MVKHKNEIRDTVHVFIQFDNDEKKVIDSRPFQRLRHIQQLALTNLVYPGATHKRFEHSLGVMELASRVFDVITHPQNVHRDCADRYPRNDELVYWRKCLRMAALCHDIGHLPFSHAAEKELLPEGWTHERLTVEIINSEEMCSIWGSIRPPLVPLDICKIAVGPKEFKKIDSSDFSDWNTILTEIVTGKALGVDRMDYLLRDSLHTGVSYGRFDHSRLIDTMRILPRPTEDNSPALGIEEGGVHSAEALLWARYFMFTQLYFHHVRRIYDLHLKEFLQHWLNGGKFSTDIESHLDITDIEVLASMRKIRDQTDHPAQKAASRILERKHFRLIYHPKSDEIAANPEASKRVYEKLGEEFGEDCVRYDFYSEKGGEVDFPMSMYDGKVDSVLGHSKTLSNIPAAIVDYVYIDPDKREVASKWLQKHREEIIGTSEVCNENV
jgi:hypothetical protein